MSKNTQGFGSQGGRSFAPKSTTGGGYSPSELDALAKVGATDLGLGNIDPEHVALCKFCGRPVAGDPKSDPVRYLEEIARQMHFACFMDAETSKLARAAATAKAEFAQLSPEEQEARRAEAYNTAMVDDTGRPLQLDGVTTQVNAYRPKPGELSFDKVNAAGGVSKALPDAPDPIADAVMDTDRTQTAAVEAEDIAALRAAGLITDAPPTSVPDPINAVLEESTEE